MIAGIDSSVIAMNVCEFQKDRDKQVQRKCFILRFIINFRDFTGTRGRRIGEASNPVPRLPRQGPRSVQARMKK